MLPSLATASGNRQIERRRSCFPLQPHAFGQTIGVVRSVTPGTKAIGLPVAVDGAVPSELGLDRTTLDPSEFDGKVDQTSKPKNRHFGRSDPRDGSESGAKSRNPCMDGPRLARALQLETVMRPRTKSRSAFMADRFHRKRWAIRPPLSPASYFPAQK
jgi:hypothetical protein